MQGQGPQGSRKLTDTPRHGSPRAQHHTWRVRQGLRSHKRAFLREFIFRGLFHVSLAT